MSTGFPIDELATTIAKIKGISVGDALRVLNGRDFANSAQWAMRGATGGAKGVLDKGIKGTIARMAGSKPVYNALRVVPGLTAGLAALDAADIVTNDTNIGNKLMDTTAMGIGGVLGAVGGPVGAMAGASTGKFVSDGLQWLFGDKKTPEQRRLEEALALIGGKI